MRRTRFLDLLASGVILAAAAVAAYGALRLICGERPAHVRVEWSASVDDPSRRELERVHGLTQGGATQGRTWAYYLTDLSEGNIRALVTAAAVESTGDIDRTAFRVSRTAQRGAYIGPRRAWIGPLLESVVLLLVALGVAAFGAAVLEWTGPRALRPPLEKVAPVLSLPAALAAALVVRGPGWIAERVPPATAESLAVFRIVLGAALFGFFLSHAVSAEWIPLAVAESPIHRLALSAFEAAPVVADWIRPWMAFWTVLFVAGALARTSFVMMTIGALAWSVLYTMRFGAHSVGILVVTMVCLMWSRWGDAWSVDAWRRGRRVAAAADLRGPAAMSRVYGYSMWIPGFVLGTSFLAAALAKLREGGLSWITNGTVKYHFLTDSPQAPVDWGLRLAHYDSLAILLSFGAVAIEALVIVGACSARYRYRLAAGAATLALLVGFGLFQGLLWPAWWILLLSFLPWHLLPTPGMPPARDDAAGLSVQRPRLAIAQTAVILAIVAQQLVASAGRIELEPFVSWFDMYSTTYASPADYESKAGMSYWIVATLGDGTTGSCEVSRADADAVSGATIPRVAQLVTTCFHDAAPSVRALSVEGRRRRVDWERWQFGEEVSVPLAGPVSLVAN